jgi:hypothetical protein
MAADKKHRKYVADLEAEVEQLRTERNARQMKWEAAETARVNVLAEVKQLLATAQTVCQLLELGDQRLLASDDACGERNAAVALSPPESARLYEACKRIAKVAEPKDGPAASPCRPAEPTVFEVLPERKKGLNDA